MIMSNGDDAIIASEDLQQSVVNPFVIFAYILVIIPAAMLVFFSIRFFITHPKNGKRALMGIGIFAAVLFLGWLMADGTIIKGTEEMANEMWTRLSGMSLYVFYIMAICTIGAILFTELYKVIKR